jgi:hypothetical protein
MRRLLILAMIAFIPVALVGQDEAMQKAVSGFVIGELGILDNLGYTNPLLGIGGGVELNSKQMLSTSQFTWSLSHKLETQDGHTEKIETANYTRLGQHFLFGAGTKYSQLVTSQWSKRVWSPFIGMGFEGEDYRIQARYVVPSFDVQNRLSGLLSVFDCRASRHFGTEIRWGIYRFKDTRVRGVFYASPAEKHTGAETDLALKYFF